MTARLINVKINQKIIKSFPIDFKKYNRKNANENIKQSSFPVWISFKLNYVHYFAQITSTYSKWTLYVCMKIH